MRFMSKFLECGMTIFLRKAVTRHWLKHYMVTHRVCAVRHGYGMSKKPSFNAQVDTAPEQPRDVSGVQNAVPVPVKRTIAGNKSPYTVLGKTYTLLPESHGYKEQGLASWYGQKFHGRNTSNGEVYDMYIMAVQLL